MKSGQDFFFYLIAKTLLLHSVNKKFCVQIHLVGMSVI